MDQEKMFLSVCDKHGRPCMIKTGMSDGPNKGRSYLICSNSSSPCDYNVPFRHPPQTCSKHQQIAELISPAVKDGERRIYIRCLEGKQQRKWCYYDKVGSTGIGSSKEVKKVELRALKDVNVMPQPKQVQKIVTITKPEPKQDASQQSVRPKHAPMPNAGSTDLLQIERKAESHSAAMAASQSLIDSAKDPVAARQYIVSEIEKKQNLLRMSSRLPDGGQKIKDQVKELHKALKGFDTAHPSPATSDTQKKEAESFKLMQESRPMNNQSRGTVLIPDNERLPPHVLREMYGRSAPDDRLYGGRMTEQRLQAVTTITSEALETLHKQLESCPSSDKASADPEGLLVPLMNHQRQALTWLLWREKQAPAGGILADDMGLGKTLTMISLVMQDKQSRRVTDDDSKTQWLNKAESLILSHGTLIVCPASLVHQWAKEVEVRCKKGSLSCIVYHGANREKSMTRLSKADIVITTYNLVQREVQLPPSLKEDKCEQGKPANDDQVVEGDGLLARIAWRRVVLDEAHVIKNSRSTTALSVCRLRAKHRWALTGTPIQNDLSDFYSLLRFLRCSPFDELKVWKKWVDNKDVSGDKRLAILIKSLLLRRTKDQKLASGEALVPLPKKNFITHNIDLGSYERKLYEQLFGKSKSVMMKYLSSKSNDSISSSQAAVTGEKVSGDTILLMLLRLRQCCSHPLLTKEALVEEDLMGEGVDLDLVSAMKELGIQDKEETRSELTAEANMTSKSVEDRDSTKILVLLKKIREMKSTSTHRTKFVVVSQWTSMLQLVAKSLQAEGYTHYTIQGNVPPKKRTEMVHDFNTNPSSPPVMLVSLRAGGVGLNLTGANNLFIMDLHWNPALELQACDRIYRMGQQHDVVIHKFVCKDTIEEQILLLQKKKTELASSALTGSKMSQSKLTLNDLKMLFRLQDPYPLSRFGGQGFM